MHVQNQPRDEHYESTGRDAVPGQRSPVEDGSDADTAWSDDRVNDGDAVGVARVPDGPVEDATMERSRDGERSDETDAERPVEAERYDETDAERPVAAERTDEIEAERLDAADLEGRGDDWDEPVPARGTAIDDTDVRAGAEDRTDAVFRADAEDRTSVAERGDAVFRADAADRTDAEDRAEDRLDAGDRGNAADRAVTADRTTDEAVVLDTSPAATAASETVAGPSDTAADGVDGAERADAAEQTGAAEGAPAAGTQESLPNAGAQPPATTLWADGEAANFHERWRDVQLRFVDDPHAAAQEAESLVGSAVEQLTGSLAARRDELANWHSANENDTEQMRVALRRYRAFLDRLLGM